MSDTNVGVILIGPQERDAIHIAVAPVIASEDLKPAQQLRLIKADDNTLVGPATLLDPIGIVDSFLTVGPKAGEQFWMFLFPKTITSLKHHWSHPAFNNTPVKPKVPQESLDYLTNFAREVEMSYTELIAAAERYIKTGDIVYLSFDTPDICWKGEDFWWHYEIVTGTSVNSDKETTFFRCAC